jgi:hypothetical protein
MVKTNSNFRLSKTSKRMLGLAKWQSDEQRNGWKRMMIDAEYTASIPVRLPKQRNDGPKE